MAAINDGNKNAGIVLNVEVDTAEAEEKLTSLAGHLRAVLSLTNDLKAALEELEELQKKGGGENE